MSNLIKIIAVLIGFTLSTSCVAPLALADEAFDQSINISAELDSISLSFEMRNIGSEPLFVSAFFCYEQYANVIVLAESDLTIRPEKALGILRSERGPLHLLKPNASLPCQIPLGVRAGYDGLKSEPVVILWQIKYFVGNERGDHKTVMSYGQVRASAPLGQGNKQPELLTDDYNLALYLERDDW